jgi:hypothetical protein
VTSVAASAASTAAGTVAALAASTVAALAARPAAALAASMAAASVTGTVAAWVAASAARKVAASAAAWVTDRVVASAWLVVGHQSEYRQDVVSSLMRPSWAAAWQVMSRRFCKDRWGRTVQSSAGTMGCCTLQQAQH